MPSHNPGQFTLPLLTVASLVHLVGGCEAETADEPGQASLEVDAAMDPESEFRPDPGILPSDRAERLAFHGKRSLVPAARPSSALSSATLEGELPNADARRLHANNGNLQVLFARVRGNDGDSSWVDGEARGELLRSATIDPMDMDFRAIAAQADVDLRVDIRVLQDRESGRRVVTEQLLYDGENPAPIATPVWEQPSSAEALTRMVEAELSETEEPVILDDGRLLAYVAFAPKLPWDTQQRVAWFEAQDSRDKAVLAADLDRKADVARALSKSRSKLDALGLCSLVEPSPVQNAAWIACDEDELVALAQRGGRFVQAIDVIEQGRSNGVDGGEIRSATGSQTQIALDEGHDGRHGTGGRSAIKVALLDGQGFHRAAEHPALDDWRNGPSRVRAAMTCAAWGCWADPTNGNVNNHGSTSMLGAFSDVLQDQDPSVADDAAQERRSHGAHEAELEVYRWLPGGGERGLIRAADPSFANGVDIATISWSGGSCGNELASTSWRDAWDYAYSQGVLGFMSAGNNVNRTNDNCTTNGWATRADLLVVGAFGDGTLTTTNGKPPTPLGDWTYDTQPVMGWHWTDLNNILNCTGTNPTCWHSAYGGAELRFSPSLVLRARSVVDLAAPAGRELAPRMNGTTPIYETQCCGTSDAAPTAAAAAVTFKDWAVADGHNAFNDPGFMHVAMLLMGDGTGNGKDPDPGPAPAGSSSGMNQIWGAGRLKMRLWDNVGLDGPSAWGIGGFFVYDGDIMDIPIGGSPMAADVDAWTGALAWNEPWLDSDDTARSAADIVFHVVTTDPVGGQCVNPQGSHSVTTVYSDLSYDPTKRIRLRPGQIEQLDGKCAWMRVEAYNVPPDQDGYARRFVYRADMWEDLDRESFENLADIE